LARASLDPSPFYITSFAEQPRVHELRDYALGDFVNVLSMTELLANEML